MGKNRVEVQTAETRIANMTSAKKVATTTTTQTVDPADLAVSGELADASAFNFVWEHDPDATTKGTSFQVFDYIVPGAGNTLRDKLVFGYTGDWDPNRTGDNNIRDQLDIGREVLGWQDMEITWGFYNFRVKLGPNSNGEHKGYTQFTEAQKLAAMQSIADWDELIAPTFKLVDVYNHDARNFAQYKDPDILLANTTTGAAQAWAYYPDQGGGYKRSSSDVWIGAAANNKTELFDGGYGLATQVHELGHTLGLSHPGEYDAGSGLPITYVDSAFYFQDNRQYTTMSYFNSYEVGSNWIDWNIMRVMYSSTPMVDDIWVIQQKYGADMHTREGNTTYGFNSTSDVTNSVMKFAVGERMPIFSIWDAAGNDTLDLSGYYTPSVIDLREGAYSSAGGLGAYDPAWVGATPDADLDAYLAFVNGNQAAAGYGSATRNAVLDLYFGGRTDPLTNEGVPWSDIVGRDWLMENNIGIAYGAVIENAIGGHGNDRITGNWETNHLTGGDGADTFVIIDDSGFNAVGVERTDTRHDYIEDFDAAEHDKIDLSSFASVTASSLSFDAGTHVLSIDTDGVGGADFFVTLVGVASIDTTNDIVYHS